ncbi:MAG TPA: hypothetical protein VN579_00195 [Bryobacteraceae bacterium]|nr:hypothetical protein [Bryobacteraceae bacterium]
MAETLMVRLLCGRVGAGAFLWKPLAGELPLGVFMAAACGVPVQALAA